MGEGKSISIHSSWEQWKRRVQQRRGEDKKIYCEEQHHRSFSGVMKAADELLALAITSRLN